ncbi:MAG: VOC family protein [Thermoplasmata archaeon]|nr:VOC family protein [Thermoplasmata archaeon]
MPKPARFLYSGLRVRDLERSLRFYRRLGFRVLARGTMDHGGAWVHLVYPHSRHRLELNYYPKANKFWEPFRAGTEFDHFGFYAPDVRGWLRTALKAGGKLVADFTEGKARLVYVRDPDGNWLEAFGPAAGPRRPRKSSS